jgi:aminoglycoside phosphotransferase (APT) family kinase protein
MPHKSQIPRTDKQIIKIIQEYFPSEKIKSVSEIKKAFVNPVYEFELSNEESYILKINNPEWPTKQTRELKAITLAKKKTTMPLPRIVANYQKDDKYPFSFSILEKLLGMDLKSTVKQNLITKKEFLSVVRKVGFHLGELHSINFDFYGDFCIKQEQNSKKSNNYFWGKQFTSWTDCFKAFCFDMLNWVDRTSFPIYRKPLEWKINELSEIIEEPNTKGCFVHSDIQPSNILVKNGRVSGIIDFEWAYSGSPSFDFYLTKAGFYFGAFPSLVESEIVTQLDLNQKEVHKELLAGYQTSYKLPIADLSDELIDFVWLLYMIGSWKWSIQTSPPEEIEAYEKSIHGLFSRIIS